MDDITNDLPNYLVFLILKDIKRLRELSPDHILVKAVESALDECPLVREPVQAELDLY